MSRSEAEQVLRHLRPRVTLKQIVARAICWTVAAAVLVVFVAWYVQLWVEWPADLLRTHAVLTVFVVLLWAADSR